MPISDLDNFPLTAKRVMLVNVDQTFLEMNPGIRESLSNDFFVSQASKNVT